MKMRVAGVAAMVMLTVIPAAMGQFISDKKPVRPQPVAHKGLAPLIPRAVLFGNPEKAGAQISPDAGKIAFLAPDKGVLNVWVAPRESFKEAKVVTSDTGRGIRRYFWAYTSSHIIYLQDTAGDENWHAYSVDLESGKAIDLTPFDGVSAQVAEVSDKFPDEIVIGMNDRDPTLHDLYRVNIRTGERTQLLRNDGYLNYDLDDNYHVRFAYKLNPDGSMNEYTVREKDGKHEFEQTATIPMEDVEGTSTVGFDKTGNTRYMTDTRGRNTAALFAVDLATGKSQILFQDDRTDAGRAMIHPVTKEVQAVAFNYEKPRWALLDRSLERDWQFIRKNAGDGDLEVPSRSQDDRYWIVNLAPDDASSRTYLYDRGEAGTDGARTGQQKIVQLFVSRPALQGVPLAPMNPVLIKARDGLEMVSYLSVPVGCDGDRDGKPDAPLPMVLVVHGGPWARDSWGFNSTHQWLANRGYAVLSVNYRGSTGFGKAHVMASKREWGGKMHDDLIDSVKWATDNGIADPARIAIFGGSYGGYAALAGLTFTPDVFACGVDIVGVSNLNTFMKTIPPYWKPFLDHMRQMVGDDSTDEGRAFLAERSPVTKVDRIVKPLLIGQGAKDPRVNKAESDQVVSAMKARNIPVTYVVYPEEGHGFAKPENRMSFFAIAEAFLAQHLGKSHKDVRSEPIGDGLSGANLRIEEGADQIEGLQSAVR